MILKLICNFLTFKLFKYKTLIKYIFFEKEYVKKLFLQNFLKFYIKTYAALTLFTLKLIRLWPRGVPTPNTDIRLLLLLAAISPLSTNLRVKWTNNVKTVNLLQVI